MATRARVLLGLLAVTLLAVASNQCITRGYIYSEIGTLFNWSGSAPSWSGSNQVATYGDFTTYVQTDGSCGGTTDQLITYGAATACVVPINSPILDCNSFASDCFSPWASSNSPSGGTPFETITCSGDPGGDGYCAQATSYVKDIYIAPATTTTLTQSFTISGTPTDQSGSFSYEWSPVAAGSTDEGCTVGYGTVTDLQIALNGTTVSTTSSPTGDGTWHEVTFTTTALASGSNTFTLTATVTGASGTEYEASTCAVVVAAQTFAVDNFVLTATY